MVRKPNTESVRKHAKQVLQRIFNNIARMARRACSGDDQTAMSQCLAQIKANIKADVSVMIDAAFTHQQ